jgi:fatty-acyl-CoA synthase
VEAKAILDAVREHGVTQNCAAPIVHNLILDAPDAWQQGIGQQVHGMAAGAALPAAMIEGMARIGFRITHVYGLTEVCGPAAVAVQRSSWAAEPLPEQTRLNGRHGVRCVLQEGMTVMDPETMDEVPADGRTMGEIMFRGNIVMKSYLKNPEAPKRPLPAAGCTPATRPSSSPTAAPKSRTAARTSSSRAAGTSDRSSSRMRSTATRQ